MSHLESLIAEYLDWQGYLLRKNVKVGRLAHGGWKMELDIIGYHPERDDLVHYEPSIDALSWEKREARYEKKFSAGRDFIFSEVFPWLDKTKPIRQIAVFVSHPEGRDTIAGGQIVSIDELVGEVRAAVIEEGFMAQAAIPEQYPILRTLQLTHNGYYRVVTKERSD